MLKRLVLSLVGATFFVMAARADTITLNSSAAETTNNSGSPTQNVMRDLYWALPLGQST